MAAIASWAITIALAGCERPAEIRVQDVPKLAVEVEEFAGIGDPRDMILAALVPNEQEAWVFRLSGARDMVEEKREQFEKFVATVSFAEGQTLPAWELPAGWEAIPASPGSMRDASIRLPAEDNIRAEISVSRLPIREDWLHYRLRNFNRWRRQLQLPVAGADELHQASKSVTLKKSPSVEASIVAITGVLADSGSASMAMRGAAHPPISQPSSSPQGGASSGLSYETPSGWSPGPASSVRRASFVIRDGGSEASVSVTAFPKTGQMAEPLANINRWRAEVGMPEVEESQVAEGADAIEVGGERGLFVSLDGAGDSAGSLATRAVMVQRGELVWFFKLHGAKKLVSQETERFREFVRSVTFTE
jgi:hypothetical protein